MNKQSELMGNFDQIHTTPLGVCRIRKNLRLDDEVDVVLYLKDILKNNNVMCEIIGKNWYCHYDNIVITINKYSYTIITAHMLKSRKIK